MEIEANRLSITVDDLGSGLWSGRVKQELEARTPLRNVLFSPSPSRPAVSVDELPIRFLDARSDTHLTRLRQLSHSPAAWFRSPFVLLVLVSCPDYEEYKRDLRLRLRAMADTETQAAGQPELLFVYVRPAGSDAAAKGPARVFEAMRKDLNKAKKERCVRLDPVVPASTEVSAPAVLGLEEFDRQARDALRAAFEARAAAYAEEVRRLMLSRLDPAWSFSTLYLVKDGLAAMLEAAGLADDALREYSELEACYLEVHSSPYGRPGQQQVQAFGGKAAGDDEAALLWSPWHATRQAASQPEAPPQFLMRQALFANQARLLIKLHRHAEVAERGLNFIRSFGALLAQQERQGGAPPQLREAWCFASYLSLAEATSRLQAARVEERRKTDHGGRGGARRGRLSEAAAPGTPHSSSATSPPPQAWEWDSAAQRPVPSPRVASPVLGASAAHHGKAKQGAAAQGEAGASPQAAAAGGSGRQGPQVNWQLGVLPSSRSATANGTAAAAAGQGGAAEGVTPSGRSTPGGVGHVAAPGTAALYCLLAKLYCAARSELLRLGLAAGLELPDCAAAAGMRAAPHNAAAAAAATVEATDTQQAAAAALVPPPSNVHLAPAPLAGGPPASSDLATVDLGSSVAAGGQRQGSLQATAADGLPSQVPDSAAVEPAEQEAPLEASSEASQQEQLQLQLQRAAGAAPGNVPQLTLRSKAPAGDGDSPSSSPRSTSTHQSAATPRRERESARSLPAAASAASLGASEAAAPAAPAPSSARTEQNDLRSVERQVAAALAERATRSAGGHLHAPKAALPAEAAAGAGGASLPPWLVHWRLRTALASQQLFIELFMELSQAAASCYARCGHLRSAALLRADVADALAKQGSLQKAAELYEQQCRCYLREGWLVLAAAALPKLAACQLACGSLGLAHTAAALLSLPEPFRGTPAERHAACQLLRQAAAATEGMTGCRPLLPTSPLLAGAALPEAAVSLSAAIAAAPLKASISRFFGRSNSGSDGGAVLAPPPGAAGSGGALAAAVGDVVAVQLLVDNQLPEALLLRGVTLTLVVLQEMTVIHSPRASASPVLVLGSALKQARSSISAAGTPLRDQLSLPPNSVALESQDSVGKERYESQWQQVEELHCPLVSITAPPAAGGTHSGDAGAPDIGGGGSHERLQPLSNEVLLPPRPSLLTFLAAPVKRGLYKAVHLRAVLDQLPVHVAIQAPKPLWQPGATAGGTAGGTTGDGSAASNRRRSRADTAAGGTPLAAELPHSSPALGDAIVMQVAQARPRVQLRLLAAGGSLIAGQEQWLGVALDPQQDSLHSAQLELTWPLGPLGQPGSGALQGAGLSRLQPKGSRLGPHHRAAHSHGGDMRLGGGSSYAALSTSLTAPPFVRPEHRTAALLPAAVPRSAGTADGSDTGSSRAGSSQVAELLAAEGPASAASAWLMADGLQQLLALPLIQEGHAVNLWWRVTAGEVAAPPEQVHISPPAPRHSIRPHDVRWMGGPAEASPPAALLDVPLTLEYCSGCQRSHSRVLGAAVRQPFSVSTLARELPSGGVAVQVTLTSNMGVPAQLSRLSLQPQPGFNVTANLLDGMGLLPAHLAPFASLAASFLLATDPSAAPGADFTLLPSSKLQPSALCIDYTIDSRQQCGVAAAPVTAGAAATSVERGSPRAVVQGSSHAAADSAPCQTPGLAVLEQLDASGRQRSGSPVGSPTKRSSSPTATAGEDDEEVEGGAGRQHCLFRHLLTLEMPASKQDASGALVYVRQLGPFVATVAEATTLCWRLERSGCCDPQQPATRISFEVAAEGDHWRPQGRRHGSVTLAGHEGAVATVEATWVPLAAGTLPVPTLRLQDVSYQEVFDVGLSLSGSNAITVVDRY